MPVRFRWEKDFKDTEIGRIPKDWEVRRVGDIAKVGSGGTPSRKIRRYWGGNISWVKSQELRNLFIYQTEEKISQEAIKNSSVKTIYPPNTVLVALYGATTGEVALLKIPATVNQAIAALQGKEINNIFLFYFLNAIKLILKDISIGSAQQNLYLKDIKNVLVTYPPLPEQSRIAEVLSWFDELIEVKKKQNEILEKTAIAIFKSWFIDFEPFKDEEFVYSEELGREIPKGWEVKPIGDIADFTNGLSYKGSEKLNEYAEDSYIFITLNNIMEGGGFKTEYTWIRSNRLKNRHFLKEGDLIFANTEQTKSGRLLGSPAIVIFPPDYTKEAGVFSHHITKVVSERTFKFYLYCELYLNQEEIAQSFHTGTGVWGFDAKNFCDTYNILLPPSPILQKFHSLVQPLFEKIINNQKEIMILKKVRDTLLPLLVFGKLRVEEV